MTVRIDVPAWVDELVASFDASFATHEHKMRLAIALAEQNVEHGGGPFGAAVFAGSQLVAAGVNCVLSSGLSIAHAEIVAMMRAQSGHAAHNALGARSGPYTLASSAEPCCQCYGALFWSGIDELVCGATTADVERVGFDEGPKPTPWDEQLRQRGIRVVSEVCRHEAQRALALYHARGGEVYGLRGSLI